MFPIYTKKDTLHTVLLHNWSSFNALVEKSTEINIGAMSFAKVLEYLFENEKDHFLLRRSTEKHIYENYIQCKKKDFLIKNCVEEISNIINHYEYDECKNFHENEYPEKHIYRDIKRLRAYMLEHFQKFGDTYNPILWETTEDITEYEFDTNNA